MHLYGISIHALRVEGDQLICAPNPKDKQISIHALRVEGDNTGSRVCQRFCGFLSTPSGWRATDNDRRIQSPCRYFYPRPPGGGRLPRRRNELIRHAISIHALRVEGDPLHGNAVQVERISIHALRVEGDGRSGRSARPAGYFYPRPPGGGRRASSSVMPSVSTRFLSTPSGWRATRFFSTAFRTSLYFYPRPPGGGRP